MSEWLRCGGFTISFNQLSLVKRGEQEDSAKSALGRTEIIWTSCLELWTTEALIETDPCSPPQIIPEQTLVQLPQERAHRVHPEHKVDGGRQDKAGQKKPGPSSVPRALSLKQINGNSQSCNRSLQVAEWGAEGTLVPSLSNWLGLHARSIFPLKLHFPSLWFLFLPLLKWFIPSERELGLILIKYLGPFRH